MGLITFISDFGETDHYVSAVKACILRINPNLQIIDISHKIEPCNIAHASYVLKYAFIEFPEGSVHLAAVDSVSQPGDKCIAIKLLGHYFVGRDNGLFGLISDESSSQIVDINSVSPVDTNFPAKDVFSVAAAKIASGTNLSELGHSLESYKMMIPRRLKATKAQITGHVIRVDHFGNLITNIERPVFDHLCNGKSFTIQFGREILRQFHPSYNSVDNGECFIIFNSNDLMEVGINKGNAAELLGLNYDSPVFINIEN